MPKDARLVYSTESGRIRTNPENTSLINPEDAVCSVRREKKGRGGKEVTVVFDVPGGDMELKKLGKGIKRKLGTGGSAKDGCIVIQGNHVDAILAFLKDIGHQAKKTGG
jgi:translation initiation factor 1